MKWKIQIEGDYYEDRQELKQLASLSDIFSAIYDAREMIRKRLKYSDDPISDSEFKLLEEISECLNIKGLDWYNIMSASTWHKVIATYVRL